MCRPSQGHHIQDGLVPTSFIPFTFYTPLADSRTAHCLCASLLVVTTSAEKISLDRVTEIAPTFADSQTWGSGTQKDQSDVADLCSTTCVTSAGKVKAGRLQWPCLVAMLSHVWPWHPRRSGLPPQWVGARKLHFFLGLERQKFQLPRGETSCLSISMILTWDSISHSESQSHLIWEHLLTSEGWSSRWWCLVFLQIAASATSPQISEAKIQTSAWLDWPFTHHDPTELIPILLWVPIAVLQGMTELSSQNGSRHNGRTQSSLADSPGLRISVLSETKSVTADMSSHPPRHWQEHQQCLHVTVTAFPLPPSLNMWSFLGQSLFTAHIFLSFLAS